MEVENFTDEFASYNGKLHVEELTSCDICSGEVDVEWIKNFSVFSASRPLFVLFLTVIVQPNKSIFSTAKLQHSGSISGQTDTISLFLGPCLPQLIVGATIYVTTTTIRGEQRRWLDNWLPDSARVKVAIALAQTLVSFVTGTRCKLPLNCPNLTISRADERTMDGSGFARVQPANLVKTRGKSTETRSK